MKYLEILEPACSFTNTKINDYQYILHQELWNKITANNEHIFDIFKSCQSKSYLDFLKWIYISQLDYNWKLHCHIIKFFYVQKKTLNQATTLSLLTNAASNWGLEDISENKHIYFYLPNQENILITYEKSFNNKLNPTVKVFKCNLSTDIRVSNSEIYYGLGTTLAGALQLRKRL